MRKIESKLRIRSLRINASFGRVCSHILGGQDRVSCLILSCSRSQEFLDLWNARFSLIWLKRSILSCKMCQTSLSSICACLNGTNASSIRRTRSLPYHYEDSTRPSQMYLFHNSSSSSWRQSWRRISSTRVQSCKLHEFWRPLL